MTPSSRRQEDILVVDDQPENLRLLAGILLKQGYKVRPVRSGKMALTSVENVKPDLILLDMMMPELDGLTLCRMFKEKPHTADIPVIFITARDNIGDKMNAFEAGAVDYITKPFQMEEVIARVNAHLMLRRTQNELEAQIVELDAFAHTVAHDLKNPLGTISGYADVLKSSYRDMSPDDVDFYLQQLNKVGLKAINIIDELLLLASVRKADVSVTPVKMTAIVDLVLTRLNPLIESNQATVIAPNTLHDALGYGPWLEEVWMNYLSNALKYGGVPPKIELGETLLPNGQIQYWVKDNGGGLLPDKQAVLFTEFTRLSEIRVQGHGLGLSIVRRIMDKLGGEVGVESEIGKGSLFSFTLPIANAKVNV